MKIYLASRYSRIAEMQAVAADLVALGHTVTSRWIMGLHAATDDRLEEHAILTRRFAMEDLEDVHNADCCISFTEPARTGPTRGGRHVEFGAALAWGKRCYVIGHRENVFHYLPEARFFPAWKDALPEFQQRAA